MLLKEILNKPYNYKWNFKGMQLWIAEFATESKVKYEVGFNDMNTQNNPDMRFWEVQFHNLDQKNASAISGTGDEFRVFATIMAITQEVIKKTDPKILYFTAKEKSRVSLYKKLISKFAKQWGFFLKDTGKNADGVTFQLEKKQ